MEGAFGLIGVIIGAVIASLFQIVAARHERRARYTDSLRLAYATWASDLKTALAIENDIGSTSERARLRTSDEQAFDLYDAHLRQRQESISAVGRSQYILLLLEECPHRRATVLLLNAEFSTASSAEALLKLASRLDQFLLDLISQQALYPEQQL